MESFPRFATGAGEKRISRFKRTEDERKAEAKRREERERKADEERRRRAAEAAQRKEEEEKRPLAARDHKRFWMPDKACLKCYDCGVEFNWPFVSRAQVSDVWETRECP